MAAAVSRFVGARYVVATDRNHYRLNLARRLGATLAVDYTATTLDQVMTELGMLEGFDIGLEMSGSPEALRSMLAFMNHGGRVALLGIPDREIPIDWNQVIFRGLTLKGIYGREMFETWYRMGTMLQSGLDITPVITHRFAARDYAQAFDVVRSGQCGKVVMDWTE
jgi:threonine 3-dehydrogenase